MVTTRTNYVLALTLVLIYFIGMSVSATYDRDFGKIGVGIISIPDVPTSGLLYRPIEATAERPCPAVVLVHGISGSKQMLSGIALELARNGFVALAIDLVGHGDSGGVFGGTTDRTLGTMAAVRYLEEQQYVNASSIGLVGHSLGAGAARATAAAHSDIFASVYIAGGFGEMVDDPEHGVLNSTFPKNLLVIVGEHDVLFDLNLFKKQLIPIFADAQDILCNRLYGSFLDGTARKLLTPTTTHLFEPVDQSVVLETANWINDAMGSEDSTMRPEPTYISREMGIVVSLVALVGMVFPISSIAIDSFASIGQRRAKATLGSLEDWKILVSWGFLGLLLFIPIFLLGFVIPFPPLIFGSSFAWWLLVVAIAGLAMALSVLPKYSTIRIDLRSAVSRSFNLRDSVFAVGMFGLLYSVACLTETVLQIDLRFLVIPVFNALKSVDRFLSFLVLVPFFMVYFFTEGLYLHGFHDWSEEESSKRSAISMAKVVLIRILPYAILLCVHYPAMFWLNIRVLPSFLGFLMEFLLGVIPLFGISVSYSWWFYRKTSTVGIGAILNSLLFAWSAAATFPLGSFTFRA